MTGLFNGSCTYNGNPYTWQYGVCIAKITALCKKPYQLTHLEIFHWQKAMIQASLNLAASNMESSKGGHDKYIRVSHNGTCSIYLNIAFICRTLYAAFTTLTLNYVS